MQFFTMKHSSANAQGIWYYYGTFVFNPLHLPLIPGEKYPVHLPGCARLPEIAVRLKISTLHPLSQSGIKSSSSG